MKNLIANSPFKFPGKFPIIFLITALAALVCNFASAQVSNKPISRHDLEHLLSKSIDILQLQKLCMPGHTNTPPDGYYKGRMLVKPDLYTTTLTTQEDSDVYNGIMFDRYNDMLRLIANVHPKFISNALAYWNADVDWASDGWAWRRYKNRCESVVEDIKTIDPEIVVQASPNEYIDKHILDAVGNIPNWVWKDFVGGPLPTPRKFNFEDIVFSDHLTNSNHHWGDPVSTGVPDIRKIEAQMWFYYIGRTFIDMGCEALSFSNIEHMTGGAKNSSDFGYVFQRLRDYADTRSDIRFLLITAHAFNWGLGEESGTLLFDFATSPSRPSEDFSLQMPTPNNGGHCIISDVSCSPYRKSRGGRTPSGWWCDHLPVQIFVDNYEVTQPNPPIPGGTPHTPLNNCYDPYYWDEMTWLALHDKEYRNAWIKYAYYKIKCLDPNSYLSLPVKREIVAGEVQASYFANNPDGTMFKIPSTINNVPDGYPDKTKLKKYQGYGTEATIQAILAANDSPLDWVHHDVSEHDLVGYSPHDVLRDVTIVGTDKMYYAGVDKRIHGYILKNNGEWTEVNLPNGELYKRSLVVSPDGTKLLYIGADDLLHGYDINSASNYSYFDFGKTVMTNQGVSAEYNLVYATDSRIYFVGSFSPTQPADVFGFVKSNGYWTLTTPSFLANNPNQVHPSFFAALTYDHTTDRLYYIGADFYIYGYEVVSNFTYNYFETARQEMINQGIVAHSNKLAISGDKIYYIAQGQTGNPGTGVCALVDYGTYWGTVSPTHSAVLFSGQPLVSQTMPRPWGDVAVSPNGETIVYTGADHKPYYYKNINGWNYSFNKFKGVPTTIIGGSLQFFDDQNIYYNTNDNWNMWAATNGNVNRLSFENSNCENSAIANHEPNFVYAKQSNHADSELIPTQTAVPAIVNNLQPALATKEPVTKQRPAIGQTVLDNNFSASIYPNPTRNNFKIEIKEPGDHSNYRYCVKNVVGMKMIENKIGDVITTVNVSSLTPGVYFISIYDDGQRLLKNEKLIVQ